MTLSIPRSTLGKRKRLIPHKGAPSLTPTSTSTDVAPSDTESESESQSPSSPDAIAAQDRLRKYFEARFEPILVPRLAAREADDELPRGEGDEEGESESDWSGIEDDDDVPVVIAHEEGWGKERETNGFMSRREERAFMSSKPPSRTSTTALLSKTPNSAATETSISEAAALKNDLALHRLIAESHLLTSSSSTPSSSSASHLLDLEHTGKNRHKATDLRLRALGSKKSILSQEKMPLAHRRGMERKREEVEGRRRREAWENGIVLERKEKVRGKGKGGAGGGRGRRERGVGEPGVGRFKDGVLVLRKKDVDEIQGGSGERREGRGRGGGIGRGGKRGGKRGKR